MALIACVECGRQVSDQAEACPNCGHPVRPRTAPPVSLPESHLSTTPGSKGRNTGCALIILLVVILAVVATCLPKRDSGSGSPGSTTPSSSIETAEQKFARLVSEVKDEGRPDETRLRAAKELIASYPDTDESEAAAALAEKLEANIRKTSLGKQWRYWSNQDPMTGKTVLGAEVLSNNTHNFDFPYAGAQHATLTLRRHPRHGNDVFLQIEKGQLQCNSYSGCNVLVRFGDSPPKTYRAIGPTDNSSETIFIEGFADFQKRMQAVDTVRIQADVFKQGTPTWEFDVSGFDAARMQRP